MPIGKPGDLVWREKEQAYSLTEDQLLDLLEQVRWVQQEDGVSGYSGGVDVIVSDNANVWESGQGATLSLYLGMV